ncbi:MAG TPA: M14 family zinc carboxypeptidase [Vicinamibacteria bacterium]|nr:M14 family zinc carboxypeptidase [Vicinamibacteria bacterium]
MTRSAVAAAVLASSFAPAAPAADVPEPGSAEAIAAATTEPRFLSPWVASVPEHSTVPSPKDYLGHIAGAPGELTRSAKIYGYYRALAAATPRVKVETIGTSEEGRDILLVIVGDEASLADLDGVRADAAALADPRRTDEAAAERIATRAKPVYMLHGGLHSTETGSPEMLMELVYRLAVSDAEVPRLVRERLVTIVNPVAEPDGRDRAVDWFYRHLKGKTDYDDLPPISPPYWGKYVLHDNNRDGIQRRLALTRATQDAFLRWHPVVVHDLHESIPLLSIWTGTGPYNVNLDPIITSAWHAIAFHEVTSLTALGMPGVWTWGFGEGWGHFYADSVAVNHNAIGRGYETFGNGTAETVERRIEPEEERYAGTPVTERAWYRSLPPPKGTFRWSLRNNVNYQQTGVLAALQYAALHGQDLSRNFWRTGRNAVRRGETAKPYALAIRENQDDRRRLGALVDLLRAHGIEVSRATAAFETSDGEFPAGTFVVRMDQPYRSYALDLLTAQKFPAEDATYEPYDDVAWALPFGYGVEVERIDDEAVRRVALQPVTGPVAYPGALTGRGSVYLVRDTGQEALLAARVRLGDFQVEAAEKPFSAGVTEYPAGSWILADQPGLRPALERVASELGLEVRAVGALPGVARHRLDLPRLAVLQTWADTQSAGWVRMIFDDQRVPYTLIMDEDVRRGGLRARFDVILFPNTGDSLKDIVNGIDRDHRPLAYTATPEHPSHGTPTASPDITGGLTWAGVGHLDEFVREGGVLLTLGGASTLALDGGLARDVRRARTKDLFTPGSELVARFRRPDHPIAYGYPETTSAFREDRPVYSVRRSDQGRIVLQWGAELPDPDEAAEEDEGAPEDGKDETPMVVSGGIKGASELEGKPAILDIPTGRGRIVAFDFDPIHRYLTLSDFRLVWNVILNWNDLPPVP